MALNAERGTDRRPREWSRVLRDPRLPGVEVLQARYLRHRYPPHWHEAVCVALAAQGSALLDSRRRQGQALASSVLVIPAYEIHELEVDAPTGLSYQALYVTPERLAELLADATTAPGATALDPSPARHLAEAAEGVAAADRLVWFHNAMAGRALPLEREHALLASVVAVAAQLGRQRTRGGPTPAHRAVRQAQEYLHAYVSQPVTLHELSNAAGLSMYRLARIFTAQVGMPPHAYQVQLRVLRAKRLLRAGAGIAEAASSCGFYDQAHLTAQFKRHVGVTPGAYARGHAG
jgi:AraC-like DNA-binding protein